MVCYTGRCPYELSGFGHDGDCRIFDGVYPDDAYCMQDHEPPDDEVKRDWPIDFSNEFSNKGPLF